MKFRSMSLQPKSHAPKRNIHRNGMQAAPAFDPHQGARRICRYDGLDKHPGTLLEITPFQLAF